MGATRNTGYLENLIQYDASDNVAIATTVNPSYKVTLGGNLLGTSAVFSSSNTATAFIPTGSTIPTNGMYLSAANTLNFATNSGSRLSISSTGAATFSSSVTATSGTFNSGSTAQNFIIQSTNTGASATTLQISNSSNSSFNDGVKMIQGAGVFKIQDLSGANLLALDLTNTRFGIGTPSPVKKLDIFDNNPNGTDDIVRAYQDVTTNHAFYRSQRNGGANMVIGATRSNTDGNISGGVSILWNYSAHDMVFGTNATERMRITSGGVVAFNGSSSPNSGGIDKFSLGFENGVDGWIQTWGGRPLSLNSQGNPVLIGTRTNNAVGALEVVGGIYSQGIITITFAGVNLTANTPLYWNNSNGRVGINTSSKRYKTDIVSLTKEQAEFALKLNPVEYTRIETGERELGFIAEEVKEAGLGLIVPEMDGEVITVDYAKLSVIAIAMIKEQQKQIEELKSKLN